MKKVSVVAIQHPQYPNLFLHGIRSDTGKHNLIGGHADDGETPIETARREAREEAQLEIKDLSQIANGQFKGEDDEDISVTLFLCKMPNNALINCTNDEDREFEQGGFKFIDPIKMKNKLHVHPKKNLLVQYLTGQLPSNTKQLDKSELFDNSEQLKKEVFDRVPERFQAPNTFHGWISPEGNFHRIAPDVNHFAWIQDDDDGPKMGVNEAYSKGWLSVGHGGSKSVGGDNKVLSDLLHPAADTLRRSIRSHALDWISLGDKDIDAQHYAKFGKFKPYMQEPSYKSELSGKTGQLNYTKDEINKNCQEEIEDLISLEKYEEPPMFSGQRSQNKPYIAQKHSTGKLTWYYNPEHSKQTENIINQNMPNFMKYNHPDYHNLIHGFINNVMASPTRHSVAAWDNQNTKNHVPRARHMKYLVTNQPHVKLNVIDKDNLEFHAERHGQIGGKDKWHYNRLNNEIKYLGQE